MIVFTDLDGKESLLKAALRLGSGYFLRIFGTHGISPHRTQEVTGD
jgi:hypothetical protein